MTQEKREELEAEFWAELTSNEDRKRELEKYNVSTLANFFTFAINLIITIKFFYYIIININK